MGNKLFKPITMCFVTKQSNDTHVNNTCLLLCRGLRKWISTARHRENNHSPEPSLVESSGSKQLKKLLAKEEQRLEQEQKRAAIERRRKQQQEQFQLQHELNHPLRQHHAPQSTKLVKGEFLGVLLQFLLGCNGCNTLEPSVLLSESTCIGCLQVFSQLTASGCRSRQ